MRVSLGLAVMLSACGPSTQSKIETSAMSAQPVNAAGTSAAVYLTIKATCSEPDVLDRVSASAPQRASLATAQDIDVKLVVTPLQDIPVACGKPTVLKPMGQHIQVAGLAGPVGIGHRIPLTLHFRNAGDVPIVAEITTMAVAENVDPMGMRKSHGHSAGMDMSGGNMH